MVIDLRKQLIVSFSIIVASVIIATILLYVLAGRIALESQKIQADRGISSQETGVLAVLAELKDAAPQAATYQAAINQLLPSQDDLIGFGDWVNAAANANQVSASFSFQGNPVAPTDMTPGQSAVSLQVNGSLDGITTFLKDIEATSPGFLVQIPSFDLSTSGGGYRLTAPAILFFQP